MLTRDQILSSNDLPSEPVAVPEWGGTVHVRTMSGTDRDAFEQSMLDARTKGEPNLINIRARLAVKTVANADGERLFSDQDAEALGRKSARALDRVFAVAQRLNGIGEKEAKELAGNSEAGPTGDSTSS